MRTWWLGDHVKASHGLNERVFLLPPTNDRETLAMHPALDDRFAGAVDWVRIE
jgi:hypothetical protein